MRLAYAFEVGRRAEVLRQRWIARKHSAERWQILRDIYSLKLPDILQTGCDPYFLPWDFTPIEWLAWQDIRHHGLKLYPQFPAGRFFIDFADPVLQIGVELDGKAFHDEARDRRRDDELWRLGWRIFRIPGRNSLPSSEIPWEQDDWLHEQAQYRAARYCDWGLRWSEGFFHALGLQYYGRRASESDLKGAAHWVLDQHRYVDFPLELHPGSR